MVRDDRTERGPFGRRPDPSSNPTYTSLTVYALVEKRRSAHRVVRTAARSVSRPTAASRRGNSGAPPRSRWRHRHRVGRVLGKRPHCGDAETICCVGRPFPRDRVIVTRVRTSRSEGFEYDDDDDDEHCVRVRARLTEFDRYTLRVRYPYDTDGRHTRPSSSPPCDPRNAAV